MIITFFSRPLRTLEKVQSKKEAERAADMYEFWGEALFLLTFLLQIAMVVFGPPGYAIMKIAIIFVMLLASKVGNDLSDAFKHLSYQGTITKVESPRWWQKKWRLDPPPPTLRSW